MDDEHASGNGLTLVASEPVGEDGVRTVIKRLVEQSHVDIRSLHVLYEGVVFPLDLRVEF